MASKNFLYVLLALNTLIGISILINTISHWKEISLTERISGILCTCITTAITIFVIIVILK